MRRNWAEAGTYRKTTDLGVFARAFRYAPARRWHGHMNGKMTNGSVASPAHEHREAGGQGSHEDGFYRLTEKSGDIGRVARGDNRRIGDPP